jgi:hypothetical protein
MLPVIGILDKRNDIFLPAFCQYWYPYADNIWLSRESGSKKFWEDILEFIPDPANKISMSEGTTFYGRWSIRSAIDCFLPESELWETIEVMRQHKDDCMSIIFPTKDHFFTFNRAAYFDIYTEFPTLNFSIGQFTGMKKPHIYHSPYYVHRYSYIGDERVESMLSDEKYGDNRFYRDNVWKVWRRTRSIRKALRANMGRPHPYARANKQFRQKLHIVSRYAHPRPIGARLRFFNEED